MVSRLCRSRTAGLLVLGVLLSANHAFGQTAAQKLSSDIGVQSESGSPTLLKPVKSSLTTSNIPTSSNSFNNGVNREYGSSYFYPSQKPVMWNRDSYADAASDFGYNPASQQVGHAHTSSHGHSPSHSYVPSTEYGIGDVDGYEDEGYGGGFGGLGGLGGLGGIAGVLGVKGIKGLGLLGILKAGLPLLALLLPALLLLPLVFLFLPVPVITVPSNRSFNSGLRFGDVSTKMTQLARSVLDSEKCVERMSCELSRVSRGSFLDKTLKRVFSKFESHLPKSLQRMARAYMDQSSYCNKKYACYLVDDNTVAKKA